MLRDINLSAIVYRENEKLLSERQCKATVQLGLSWFRSLQCDRQCDKSSFDRLLICVRICTIGCFTRKKYELEGDALEPSHEYQVRYQNS